jgi:hypothetical protein
VETAHYYLENRGRITKFAEQLDVNAQVLPVGHIKHCVKIVAGETWTEETIIVPSHVRVGYRPWLRWGLLVGCAVCMHEV